MIEICKDLLEYDTCVNFDMRWPSAFPARYHRKTKSPESIRCVCEPVQVWHTVRIGFIFFFFLNTYGDTITFLHAMVDAADNII